MPSKVPSSSWFKVTPNKFAGVLQKKIRKRAVFNEIPSIDTLIERLWNVKFDKVIFCFADYFSRKEVAQAVKADFQSVLRTLESLFTTFLFHVRRHKM